MTLRIGNKGLSLIEVMITVSILSLGTVMIFQSNLSSLAAYGRYSNRLSLQSWADEKIWQAKEDILLSESPNTGEISGSFFQLGRNYEWQRLVELMWESDDSKISFYKVRLTVSWNEEPDKAFLYRAAHVKKIKP